MSISMYKASVPLFIQMLSSLSGILKKAEAYAEDRKIEPSALIGCRLFPDMLPFSVQIWIAVDMATNCANRLAGIEPAPPVFPDKEETFATLIKKVEDAIALLGTFKAEQIDGTEEKTISYPSHGSTATYKGLPYLLNHTLPNFYFHVTTAYDILRHNGLEIGKKDFIGEFKAT